MPRPDATPAFIAAIQTQYVQPALFVQITFVNGPVNVWSGSGSITANGITYLGIGQFGGISNAEEGSTILARGITLTLSGIDSTLLSDTINEYRLGLPVSVYLGAFSAGALIVNPVLVWSGRTDQPTITVGGDTATISIACESRLVDMNVSVERRYTSADQQLDYPDDNGFNFVNSIQSIVLYWGRFPGNYNNFGVHGTSGG